MKRILLMLIPMLALGAGANAADTEVFKSGVFDPPRLAPDFVLQGSNGSELKLAQARGKVVALGFGFTQCANVCPVTLARLAQARKKLGALANDVQIIYVTVDPANDTPQRLREYLKNFDPTFIGATGTDAQLAAVQKEYGITAAKAINKTGQPEMHHSFYIYLIDRAGLLRALVPYGKSPDDIAHDLKILLQASKAES